MCSAISGVQADDVYDFFADFVPASYEWVDVSTCNVIWATKLQAAKAMMCLSRPLR